MINSSYILMDNQNLIYLVYERTPLWDGRNINVNNKRDIQKKLWEEVASEMDQSVQDVKQRWRSMRDVFRKEYKKSLKLKTEDGNSMYKSKWPYYDLLTFLKGALENLGDFESENPLSFETNEENENIEQDLTFEIIAQTNANTVITETNETNENEIKHSSKLPNILKRYRPIRPKLTRESDPLAEDTNIISDIQEKKPKYEECKIDDDDYQFLLSLLPFLRDIPKSRKLIVRSRLQQVFIDEMELAEASCSK